MTKNLIKIVSQTPITHENKKDTISIRYCVFCIHMCLIQLLIPALQQWFYLRHITARIVGQTAIRE